MTFRNFALQVHLVVVPGAPLTIYIGYIGTWFLLSTTGVKDFVLDAIALGFLIEIADIIYFGLTGTVKRRLLQNARPLYYRSGPCGLCAMRWLLLDILSGAAVVALACTIWFVYYRNTMDMMVGFVEEACGKPSRWNNL